MTKDKKRIASPIDRLHNLALNLWWSWNPNAQSLFAALDPKLWDATHHNPIRTLNLLSPERRDLVETDQAFDDRITACEDDLKKYLAARTWFDRAHKRNGRAKPLVAYFCAEFAVHECLPQYAGGLGVLAGDHLKSASDLGIPLVAVGLLYRSGYFTQEFNADGSTRVIYPCIDFDQIPLADTGKIISVPMAKKSIHAKIWKQTVGRVSLYLLDTDIPQNSKADRQLTCHLYGGDREYRIRQEMLLGVGGLYALDAMGLKPTAFHMNEGHAAFALERLRGAHAAGLPLDQAIDLVRSTGVFTTHTPVPAGNDRFDPAMAWKYLSGFAGALGMSKNDLLALGREDPSNKLEEFCMTVLALKLSARCNGVAKLHGDTSRKMWAKTFNLTDPDKVPIGSVTNGIHSETWLAPEIRPLYDRYLKPRWIGAGPRNDWWAAAGKIPPAALWHMRTLLRRRMIAFIRHRLGQRNARRGAPLEATAALYEMLDENILTIGFARRFATYKRAPLIFKDPKRLAAILGNARRPVQLIFAGKAHPKDTGGQAFAQEIYKFSAQPAFRGKVVLLEDYDMELGRILTSGCDVWLNNPLRPQEASGTSGMKPPLHGGINCSILDGWWPEAFNGKNGWSIGDGRTFSAQSKQDRYDATAIYELLESQIVPEFYDRDRTGLPRKWVARMLESMRSVCCEFSSHRMLAEYWQDYYGPACVSSVSIV